MAAQFDFMNDVFESARERPDLAARTPASTTEASTHRARARVMVAAAIGFK